MAEECNHGDNNAIESHNDLGSEFRCQEFCSIYYSPDSDNHECSFFIYNRKDDFCQLYDYDVKDYMSSCLKKGMTPTPSFDKCLDFDEPCAVSSTI